MTTTPRQGLMEYPVKRTSHTTKKHTRRKPIEGLTPDTLLKEIERAASEPKKAVVRKLRSPAERERDEVLSKAREGVPDPTRSGGIFGTAEDAGGGGAAVSDSARGSESSAIQLSKVLKRMLGHTPPPDLMALQGVGGAVTNAEMLGAIIMREALAGKQWAVEMVRDQTEGKPVRAAQVNNSEVETEEHLDRVSTAALNRLAEKGE